MLSSRNPASVQNGTTFLSLNFPKTRKFSSHFPDAYRELFIKERMPHNANISLFQLLRHVWIKAKIGLFLLNGKNVSVLTFDVLHVLLEIK